MGLRDDIEKALTVVRKDVVPYQQPSIAGTSGQIVRNAQWEIRREPAREPIVPHHSGFEQVRGQPELLVPTGKPPIITDILNLPRVCAQLRVLVIATYKIRNGTLAYAGSVQVDRNQYHQQYEGVTHDTFEVSSADLGIEKCICGNVGQAMKCVCGAFLCQGLIYRIGGQDHTDCPVCRQERVLVLRHWTQRGMFPKTRG